MLKSAAFALSLLLAGGLAAPAHAGARTSIKTAYYSISGKTGMDLFRDMNRKGPRHAFMKKAMAQTQYRTTPRGKMAWSNGVCSVKGGGYTLDLTYVYPKPATRLSGRLAANWRAFMADTYRHEKVHGRMAIEMANKLDGTLRRFSMKDGRTCGRALSRLTAQVNAIYADYKARQIAFDAAEHRQGGKVEKSVLLLVKE
ncbi:MAG: DUF922 domain-containing protein [Notoacmeibacter sp.]|nr:DUF922 domain-containing protein [Notoacmeibacter sp.]